MKPYYSADGIDLYLGDCREVTAWLEAEVLCTDPPYGMAYQSGQRKGKKLAAIAGDSDTTIRDAALEMWGGAKPGLMFGRWSITPPRGERLRLIWWKGLMEYLIRRCPHGVIADPFAGSGSTLVAAKLQGRKAIGVEIEERYAEICARRLSQGVLDFEGAS